MSNLSPDRPFYDLEHSDSVSSLNYSSITEIESFKSPIIYLEKPIPCIFEQKEIIEEKELSLRDRTMLYLEQLLSEYSEFEGSGRHTSFLYCAGVILFCLALGYLIQSMGTVYALSKTTLSVCLALIFVILTYIYELSIYVFSLGYLMKCCLKVVFRRN